MRACATLPGMLSCFVSGPDLVVGGSPRIYAGEGALQRSGRSFRSHMRFSAGGSEKARPFRGPDGVTPKISYGGYSCLPLQCPYLLLAPVVGPATSIIFVRFVELRPWHGVDECRHIVCILS